MGILGLRLVGIGDQGVGIMGWGLGVRGWGLGKRLRPLRRASLRAEEQQRVGVGPHEH